MARLEHHNEVQESHKPEKNLEKKPEGFHGKMRESREDKQERKDIEEKYQHLEDICGGHNRLPKEACTYETAAKMEQLQKSLDQRISKLDDRIERADKSDDKLENMKLERERHERQKANVGGLQEAFKEPLRENALEKTRAMVYEGQNGKNEKQLDAYADKAKSQIAENEYVMSYTCKEINRQEKNVQTLKSELADRSSKVEDPRLDPKCHELREKYENAQDSYDKLVNQYNQLNHNSEKLAESLGENKNGEKRVEYTPHNLDEDLKKAQQPEQKEKKDAKDSEDGDKVPQRNEVDYSHMHVLQDGKRDGMSQGIQKQEAQNPKSVKTEEQQDLGKKKILAPDSEKPEQKSKTDAPDPKENIKEQEKIDSSFADIEKKCRGDNRMPKEECTYATASELDKLEKSLDQRISKLDDRISNAAEKGDVSSDEMNAMKLERDRCDAQKSIVGGLQENIKEPLRENALEKTRAMVYEGQNGKNEKQLDAYADKAKSQIAENQYVMSYTCKDIQTQGEKVQGIKDKLDEQLKEGKNPKQDLECNKLNQEYEKEKGAYDQLVAQYNQLNHNSEKLADSLGENKNGEKRVEYTPHNLDEDLKKAQQPEQKEKKDAKDSEDGDKVPQRNEVDYSHMHVLQDGKRNGLSQGVQKQEVQEPKPAKTEEQQDLGKKKILAPDSEKPEQKSKTDAPDPKENIKEQEKIDSSFADIEKKCRGNDCMPKEECTYATASELDKLEKSLDQRISKLDDRISKAAEKGDVSNDEMNAMKLERDRCDAQKSIVGGLQENIKEPLRENALEKTRAMVYEGQNGKNEKQLDAYADKAKSQIAENEYVMAYTYKDIQAQGEKVQGIKDKLDEQLKEGKNPKQDLECSKLNKEFEKEKGNYDQLVARYNQLDRNSEKLAESLGENKDGEKRVEYTPHNLNEDLKKAELNRQAISYVENRCRSTNYPESGPDALSKAEEKLLTQQLGKMFRESDFCTRVKDYNLEKIIQSGKLLSQTENTGTSNGTLDPEKRRKFSEEQYGCNMNEKYGYACQFEKEVKEKREGSINNYGDVIIKFKKDSLEGRATYYLGDSLNAKEHNGDYHLGIIGGANRETTLSGSTGRTNQELLKIAESGSIDPFEYVGDRNYLELQFLGDLTLKDIDTIGFQDKKEYEKLSDDAKLLLAENQISVTYLGDNGLVSEQPVMVDNIKHSDPPLEQDLGRKREVKKAPNLYEAAKNDLRKMTSVAMDQFGYGLAGVKLLKGVAKDMMSNEGRFSENSISNLIVNSASLVSAMKKDANSAYNRDLPEEWKSRVDGLVSSVDEFYKMAKAAKDCGKGAPDAVRDAIAAVIATHMGKKITSDSNPFANSKLIFHMVETCTNSVELVKKSGAAMLDPKSTMRHPVKNVLDMTYSTFMIGENLSKSMDILLETRYGKNYHEKMDEMHLAGKVMATLTKDVGVAAKDLFGDEFGKKYGDRFEDVMDLAKEWVKKWYTADNIVNKD